MRPGQLLDAAGDIFGIVAPFLPHTVASSVFNQISHVLEGQREASLSLLASLTAAEAKCSRESALRKAEHEKLAARVRAADEARAVIQRTLQQSLEERERLTTRLEEAEARYEAQQSRLERLASEGSDTQRLQKRLQASYQKRVARLETKWSHALEELEASFAAQKNAELRLQREADGEARLERRRVEADKRVLAVRRAAQRELQELVQLVRAMQERIEILEGDLVEAREEATRLRLRRSQRQALGSPLLQPRQRQEQATGAAAGGVALGPWHAAEETQAEEPAAAAGAVEYNGTSPLPGSFAVSLFSGRRGGSADAQGANGAGGGVTEAAAGQGREGTLRPQQLSWSPAESGQRAQGHGAADDHPSLDALMQSLALSSPRRDRAAQTA